MVENGKNDSTITRENQCDNEKLESRESQKKQLGSRAACFVRDIFERYGSVYVYEKNKKLFAAKIRIVDFAMRKDLFVKGKTNKIEDACIETFPDIQFWYNRYYYFSKFDEGVLLDRESKSY